MDAIELDMRIRLAELQRQYREKQRELAKLQPKKDKEDGVKRGRGRPRKRQFVAGKNDDESSNSSGSKTLKEGSVKRRRPAEELVDRVFRKLPPAKLGKLKMKSISLKHKKTRPSHAASTQRPDGEREAGKKKSKHRHDTGNLFSNLESSFGKTSAGKKKVKRQSDIPATITSGLSSTPTTITPVSLESGLGLLARFATSVSTPSTTFSGAKRRSEDSGPWDTGLGDTPSFGASPGHSPLNKRRESDTDNSDTAYGTCNKKRKPGRPRKCDPNKTTGFTETIWARQTGLLQLSDVAQGKTWVSKAEEAASTTTSTTASTATSTINTTTIPSPGSKLAASQASSLAPLLLDEWSLRRSERIFLSDTSPQPSPNLQPAKDSAAKAPGPRDSRSSSSGPGRPAGAGGRGRPPGTGYKQQQQRAISLLADKLRQQGSASSGQAGARVKDGDAGSTSLSGSSSSSMAVAKRKGKEEGKRDKDQAKVQKARSLQELSQRVKKKYTHRKMGKKTPAGGQGERKKRAEKTDKVKSTTGEERSGRKVEEEEEEEEDSSSEGDNVPLSALREQALTPEPRSCVIGQEELQEGLQVLFFKDCLFYEGVVQAIQPPDIYGVVIAGQRGTRPHICSREEILKDAIMAVAPGSQRYVKEGTRVCAYWSQQFRCLYPGTVAKTSPNPHSESSVNVEFDDGDSGRIPLSHIRLLPHDFPLVTEEPDPLFYPTKKRRRTISEDDLRRNTDSRSSVSACSHAGRRNSRSHTMDDTISDDGSMFDSLSLKSITSGKAGGRGRACKEDPGTQVRRLAKGKDTSATNSRSGSSAGKKTAQGTAEEEESESEEEEEEEEEEEDDGSDEEYTSEEEEEDSSSSEDEKKTSGSSKGKSRKADSGKKAGRGRKKKREDRAGGGSSRLAWRWDGPSTKRPGMRGKAKKEFYKSITRGADIVNVGDSAVFLSMGRDHCPYIGRIESLWEAWGGQMMVRVKWFYHPEETKGGKQLAQPKGALFESPHSDENDVQTISHKCQVLSFRDYNRRCSEMARKGQPMDSNTYYLAGYYDPTIGFIKLEPDVQ